MNFCRNKSICHTETKIQKFGGKFSILLIKLLQFISACFVGSFFCLQLVISTPSLHHSIFPLSYKYFFGSLSLSLKNSTSSSAQHFTFSLFPLSSFSLSYALWKVGNSIVCMILVLGLDLGAFSARIFHSRFSSSASGTWNSVFDSLDFCFFDLFCSSGFLIHLLGRLKRGILFPGFCSMSC